MEISIFLFAADEDPTQFFVQSPNDRIAGARSYAARAVMAWPASFEGVGPLARGK